DGSPMAMVVLSSGDEAVSQGVAAVAEARWMPPFTTQPDGADIVKAPSVGSLKAAMVTVVGAPPELVEANWNVAPGAAGVTAAVGLAAPGLQPPMRAADEATASNRA